MDIPEKLREVLKKDGVVAIATLGQDGPHMVNTWNSYVRLTDDGRMLIPAGYMNKTEANVAFNPEVLVTLGSSKVPGKNGPGTGFLIEGTAAFSTRAPTSIPSRRPSDGCAPSWPSRSGRRRRRSSRLPKRSPASAHAPASFGRAEIVEDAAEKLRDLRAPMRKFN